eukprot:TRINITY_DN15643_c0_g1_i1.p1 TRINITY_DN15643_c0_g1~~TRINITY_DN15643_c0_g1_i1.p1  ORF type:complete len:430 (+),score=71.06 TRINITY_DN15643_c0_g1_i1:63-1352(+)
MSELYVWGEVGQMGHLGSLTDDAIDSEDVIPYPSRVKGTKGVVQASVSSTVVAYIGSDGHAYTFGKAQRYGRLGHGPSVGELLAPKALKLPSGETASQIAIGDEHGMLLTNSGHVYSWGNPRGGALGFKAPPADGPEHPTRVLGALESEKVVFIAVGNCNSTAVTEDGKLFVWGSNERGKLGLGDDVQQVDVPTQLLRGDLNADVPIKFVSLGSLYGACVAQDGRLFTWGFGGAGNLGLGDRKNHPVPVWVKALSDAGEKVVQVACTVGQVSLTFPVQPAGEAPHTMVLTESDQVYTFGTSHKGLLGNTMHKALYAPGKPDELRPFRMGSLFRDDAATPSDFRSGSQVVSVHSAHIHNMFLLKDGRMLSFGCGSGGRCGVTKFMEGLHGKRSRMKCYLPQPELVHTLHPVSFTQACIGRHIGVAIGHRK